MPLVNVNGLMRDSDNLSLAELREAARPLMKYKGSPWNYADRELCINILLKRDEQAERDSWFERRRERTARRRAGKETAEDREIDSAESAKPVREAFDDLPPKPATPAAPQLDMAAINKMIAAEVTRQVAAIKPERIEVVLPSRDTITLDRQHMTFDRVLHALAAVGQVWLTGPAGSGKTTAAENIAKALGLPFYFNGAIDSEYKLKGFIDAGGRLISPAFRKAYEKGGVYLFDEVDSSLPQAVLAFNAALANNTCDFPDGSVKRHKDCYIIAAANTYGHGGTNDYVGRFKQDGAFVDRFVQITWDYDLALERKIAGNDRWVDYVIKCRTAVKNQSLPGIIISPRASINGARLLKQGKLTRQEIVDMTIRKGMTADQWAAITAVAGHFIG